MNYLPQMMFTLWNVEHGLAIWVKTPAGHNHWIDAGQNAGTKFSPAEWVVTQYRQSVLDYLIITHHDSDHIDNLPDLTSHFSFIRVIRQNITVPILERYGDLTRGYQLALWQLDNAPKITLPYDQHPENPAFNGGVRVSTAFLNYQLAGSKNDASVVAMYLFAGWLFVCPGDIGPAGWDQLRIQADSIFRPLVAAAQWRILVAPHHGRESGYSGQMFKDIAPHFVLISDEYGKGETDDRFRTKPLGLPIDGTTEYFHTTKTGGMMRFVVSSNGYCEVFRG